MKTSNKRKWTLSFLASITLFSCGTTNSPSQSNEESSSAITSKNTETTSIENGPKPAYTEPKSLSTIPHYSELSDIEQTNGFKSFVSKVNRYASGLSENINKSMNTEKKNIAISPASIFFALSMFTRIATPQAKAKLLSVFDMTEEDLETYVPTLFKACNRSYGNNRKEALDNTLFIDKGFGIKQSYIEDIANTFFTSMFSCDFKNYPADVSKYISQYANRKTEGLLSPSYDFSPRTAMVLLNALFFEDAWYEDGGELGVAGRAYFTNSEGEKKFLSFYGTKDVSANVYHGEVYSSAYCKTYNGFEIHYMLPNEGYTVDDVFTKQMIDGYSNVKYYSEEQNDKGQTVRYESKIAFPEYEAEFDNDVFETFRNTYNIGDLSVSKDVYTNNEPVEMGKIIHTTKVEVKKDSVKGAAATAIEMGSGAAPSEIVYHYETLRLNKPFVYTIYNPAGVKLFEGAVYRV